MSSAARVLRGHWWARSGSNRHAPHGAPTPKAGASAIPPLARAEDSPRERDLAHGAYDSLVPTDPTNPTEPTEPTETADPEDGPLARAAKVVAETVADVATQAGHAAGRLLEGELRRRRIRAGREPLPNLFDLHPETAGSPRRELGVLTIPVDEIRGTAVAGPAQRGADFKPLPVLRGSNWRGRWQRLWAAQQRLAVLPPIDVFQTDEGYWVIDGHNRVALALEVGQDDIDASVTHVRLPVAEDANPAAADKPDEPADPEE